MGCHSLALGGHLSIMAIILHYIVVLRFLVFPKSETFGQSQNVLDLKPEEWGVVVKAIHYYGSVWAEMPLRSHFA